MHFTWLGTTAIKIQTKHEGKDVVIVIDTYKPVQGNFPRSLTPDIGLYTRGEKNSITLSNNPFILSDPGECETKGILITAVSGHEDNTTMIRLDAEKMSVGHLGLTKKQLSDSQLEILSGIDILFIPFGREDSFSAQEAIKTINSIEPRIVIPMAYKTDNDPTAKTVDEFLKEIGSTSKPESKVIIKKKDLPEEETEVIVLVKE